MPRIFDGLQAAVGFVLGILRQFFQMTYSLKIFTADDVTSLERELAIKRFRAALDEAVGSAAMVLPIYRVYTRLLLAHGDAERPWPISSDEQTVVDQWETAELAATVAAFGVNRYLGDADFELGDSTSSLKS